MKTLDFLKKDRKLANCFVKLEKLDQDLITKW
jgi:hypothetical protein